MCAVDSFLGTKRARGPGTTEIDDAGMFIHTVLLAQIQYFVHAVHVCTSMVRTTPYHM